jgi:hypothetical protein
MNISIVFFGTTKQFKLNIFPIPIERERREREIHLKQYIYFGIYKLIENTIKKSHRLERIQMDSIK